MTSKRVYFLRHGQAEYNIKGTPKISTHDAVLTPTGRQQCIDFA
ncbi:histidine phosphatase family (branch 1) protein [Rhizoctonia solani 123E]|uniref:Histidine phosphatase family (Branch 1) protein n=1 Tax=Rhizoctonia solani 123E TaxID=1423351 RepID=A0A074SEF3_9AGAM|nr:histidine phosphatase family (branch 1) protein [Rhizoctonia solani 123E]